MQTCAASLTEYVDWDSEKAFIFKSGRSTDKLRTLHLLISRVVLWSSQFTITILSSMFEQKFHFNTWISEYNSSE